MGFTRRVLVEALVLQLFDPATSLPILRAKGPVVDPVDAASEHFGLGSLFRGSPNISLDGDTPLGAVTTRLTHILHGDGFHRRLSVEYEATLPGEYLRLVKTSKCQAVFIHRLDPHLYADRFELSSLFRNTHEHASVVFENSFTISEKAAPDCGESVLAVVAPLRAGLETDTRTSDRFVVTANAQYPLHNRYPGIVGDSTNAFIKSFFEPRPYVEVDLEPPKVLLRCANDALEGTVSENKNVIPQDGWSASSYGDGAEVSGSVQWQIPAGNAAHLEFINTATFVVRYVVAIFVLYHVWKAPRPALVRGIGKKKKQ